MSKSKCFIFLLLFSAVFVYAQGSTRELSAIKVKGVVTGSDGKFIYLHHKSGGTDHTDSVRIKKGGFVFSIRPDEPNLYWFTMGPDINDPANVPFFTDNAAVSATVVTDSLQASVVNAGRTHEDYLEYRRIINTLVQVQRQMQTDFNEAAQRGDMNTQQAIRAEYGELNTRFLADLKNFIKAHPRSPVSGYVIYNDFNNPAIPIDHVEEALTYLDKSLSESEFVKLAAKRVNEARGATVGYTATDFAQNDPAGKPVKLSDFRGKYVLLDFWASWCRPCRMENPNVVAAYRKFKDKDFTVLGVSLDSKKEPWLAAIEQDELTWTQVSDLKGWGNEVGKLYGVSGIPQNFLINKDGKIIAKDLRGPALEQKLAEVLENGN